MKAEDSSTTFGYKHLLRPRVIQNRGSGNDDRQHIYIVWRFVPDVTSTDLAGCASFSINQLPLLRYLPEWCRPCVCLILFTCLSFLVPVELRRHHLRHVVHSFQQGKVSSANLGQSASALVGGNFSSSSSFIRHRFCTKRPCGRVKKTTTRSHRNVGRCTTMPPVTLHTRHKAITNETFLYPFLFFYNISVSFFTTN